MNIILVKYMKENLKIMKEMDLAYLHMKKILIMKEILKNLNLKDMENLLLMKIMNMKEFGKVDFQLETKKILK